MCRFVILHLPHIAVSVIIAYGCWTRFCLRLSRGDANWERHRGWLRALAVSLQWISGDRDYLREIRDPTVPAQNSPLQVFQAMDNPLSDEYRLLRDPIYITRCTGFCLRWAIMNRLFAPVDRLVQPYIDTDPSGPRLWRATGSFVIALSFTPSLLGYILGVPLVLVFGPIAGCGFLLHVSGLRRSLFPNRIAVVSRSFAAVGCLGWTISQVAGHSRLVGACLILMAGMSGMAEYMGARSRRRRWGGTVGSGLVAIGAGCVLGGVPVLVAGALMCIGGLVNVSLSLLRHLGELRRGFGEVDLGA